MVRQAYKSTSVRASIGTRKPYGIHDSHSQDRGWQCIRPHDETRELGTTLKPDRDMHAHELSPEHQRQQRASHEIRTLIRTENVCDSDVSSAIHFLVLSRFARCNRTSSHPIPNAVPNILVRVPTMYTPQYT